eukprot:symbB.v1.2.007888.t1/scaffold489.1/size197246/6
MGRPIFGLARCNKDFEGSEVISQEPRRPHQALQSLEPDSDCDSEDEKDPDDGTGSFLDYLRRRLLQHWPGKVHHIDSRDLGDEDHPELRPAFQALLSHPLPPHPEELEVDRKNLKEFQRAVAPRKARRHERPQALPSWEAFLGAAAELLYYSPHIKADYVPFLTACVINGSDAKAAVLSFFRSLVFGTVPEAISKLSLEGERRSMTCLRSLTYREADGTLWQRPYDDGLVQVRWAPLGGYLKAKGSDPPRTWISGLAETLRQRHPKAELLLRNAEDWYFHSVQELLADPKGADADGDYFLAWLRECHREVYADVDRSDPKELRSLQKARSKSQKNRKRYDLGSICIPNLEMAFEELSAFDPASKTAANRRQRVLAKIIIDSFQLRSVDLAAVLTMAECMLEAQEGEEVVVVLYAGGTHSHCVEKFWRSQGFTSDGLPKRGLVGKEDWEDDEPRGLVLPRYLHDFDQLFDKSPTENGCAGKRQV